MRCHVSTKKKFHTQEIFVGYKTVDDFEASLCHLPFFGQAFVRLVVKVEENVVDQQPTVRVESCDSGRAAITEKFYKKYITTVLQFL